MNGVLQALKLSSATIGREFARPELQELKLCIGASATNSDAGCSLCRQSFKLSHPLATPGKLSLADHESHAMSTSADVEHAPSVIPAQLSFLTIYNPSFGKSDESLRDQIVFYSSKTTRAQKPVKNEGPGVPEVEHEEENEQLRQVGLAQGMVDFAKWVLI